MASNDMISLHQSMGAHARASYSARLQALKEYGIHPSAVNMSQMTIEEQRESSCQNDKYRAHIGTSCK